MVGAAGTSAATETRSGLTVVPFEPEHLLEIEPGQYEHGIFSTFDMPGCVRNWPPGPAFSALQDDIVLGCAGLLIAGDEALAWAFLTDELRGHPMFLFRAVHRKLEELSAGIRRIWMTVPSDFPAARRWARALGFRFNRIRPGYGPLGETHLEYVK